MTYPLSDHCDGRRFFNTDPAQRQLHGLVDLLRWRAGGHKAAWPGEVISTTVPDVSAQIPSGQARITMVNHACLLVQLAGVNVLTDPVFGERVSPVSFAGPRRVQSPGIPIEKLPPIDVVVISHNHFDHLELTTLQALWRRDRPHVVVPLGNAALLRRHGIEAVEELDWWQKVVPRPGIEVALTEAQHWSARGLFDRNRALWGGFVLSAGGVRVFFAGDTGYGGHFAAVRERLGPIDVALLPIGAYEPRWFMRSHHMSPAEAVRAHLDLGAERSLGMHFGTFQLSDEAIDAPAEDLAAALRGRGMAAAAFVPLANGEGVTFSRPQP